MVIARKARRKYDVCFEWGMLAGYTAVKLPFPYRLVKVVVPVILNFNGMLSDYDLSVFLCHPLFHPLS